MLMVFFQNCSDVNLVKSSSFTETDPGDGQGLSYLKIPPNTINQYRALFVIDMSHSMEQAPCDGSGTIDFLIDNVEPLPSCSGPTGIDPEGKRYQLLFRWLQDLRQIVSDGKIENSKIKFLALPFAGVAGIASFIDLNNAQSILRKVLNTLSIPANAFIELDQFEIYIETLWAIELAYHSKPFHPRIRGTVLEAVRANNMGKGGSSGTSIPYTILQAANTNLVNELVTLGSQKANFEIVYLSDGVPKPHPKHIEAAVKKVWKSKAKVFDDRYNIGWTDVHVGNRCEENCSGYLDSYIEAGAVTLPPLESPKCKEYQRDYMGNIIGCVEYEDGSTPETYWGIQIKCEACFRLVKQFDWTEAMPGGFNPSVDRFYQQIRYRWGDWVLNRHSRIISELKITESIFTKQYTGHRWRMNFLRIDSDDARYRLQEGELTKEINWMERAKDYFIKRHRFMVVREIDGMFDLFSDLSKKNQYKIGMVYAYPRNYRSHVTRGWQVDRDIDGVIDAEELPMNQNNKRSNGVCLDTIVKKYSACISFGCNPNVDSDSDGLNQCEELTLGTSDYDVDSDGDGIIDEAEILSGFNPVSDDREIFLSPDGFSNFEHFIRGYSAAVDLRTVVAEQQIHIQTEVVGHKQIPNAIGYSVWTPAYRIKIKNIPVSKEDISLKTKMHVVVLVQNQGDPYDMIWLSKTYELGMDERFINIDFNEFQRLNLRGL